MNFIVYSPVKNPHHPGSFPTKPPLQFFAPTAVQFRIGAPRLSPKKFDKFLVVQDTENYSNILRPRRGGANASSPQKFFDWCGVVIFQNRQAARQKYRIEPPIMRWQTPAHGKRAWVVGIFYQTACEPFF